MSKTDSQALQMKKLTLAAWANILFRQGQIDAARLGRMLTLIERLKETDGKSPPDN